MKPKAYLKKRGLTIAAAAKELNVTRQWLTNVVNNRVVAGRKLAQRFEKWSGGEVLASEMLRLNDNKKFTSNTTINRLMQFLKGSKST